MEQIVKAFIGFILAIALTIIGIGITSGMVTVNNANKAVDEVVAEIEDGNFSKSVINNAINNIKAAYNDTGEEITVTVYRTGDTKVTHNDSTFTDAELENVNSVKITLTYRYHIFGSDKKHVVERYAR